MNCWTPVITVSCWLPKPMTDAFSQKSMVSRIDCTHFRRSRPPGRGATTGSYRSPGFRRARECVSRGPRSTTEPRSGTRVVNRASDRLGIATWISGSMGIRLSQVSYYNLSLEQQISLLKALRLRTYVVNVNPARSGKVRPVISAHCAGRGCACSGSACHGHPRQQLFRRECSLYWCEGGGVSIGETI